MSDWDFDNKNIDSGGGGIGTITYNDPNTTYNDANTLYNGTQSGGGGGSGWDYDQPKNS